MSIYKKHVLMHVCVNINVCVYIHLLYTHIYRYTHIYIMHTYTNTHTSFILLKFLGMYVCIYLSSQTYIT